MCQVSTKGQEWKEKSWHQYLQLLTAEKCFTCYPDNWACTSCQQAKVEKAGIVMKGLCVSNTKWDGIKAALFSSIILKADREKNAFYCHCRSIMAYGDPHIQSYLCQLGDYFLHSSSAEQKRSNNKKFLTSLPISILLHFLFWCMLARGAKRAKRNWDWWMNGLLHRKCIYVPHFFTSVAFCL